MFLTNSTLILHFIEYVYLCIHMKVLTYVYTFSSYYLHMNKNALLYTNKFLTNRPILERSRRKHESRNTTYHD